MSTVKSERDRSFLVFAGVVLVAVAFGFKSELLGQGQVWALALALVVVAARLRDLIARTPALGQDEVTVPYETVAFSCEKD